MVRCGKQERCGGTAVPHGWWHWRLASAAFRSFVQPALARCQCHAGKNHAMKRLILSFVAILAATALFLLTADRAAAAGWKAGAASETITPATFMWMAGYGARNRPASGLLNDLHAKALVLEDPRGTRVAVVTLDLVGISPDLTNPICTSWKPSTSFSGPTWPSSVRTRTAARSWGATCAACTTSCSTPINSGSSTATPTRSGRRWWASWAGRSSGWLPASCRGGTARRRLRRIVATTRSPRCPRCERPAN